MTRNDFEILARFLGERYPHNSGRKQEGYDAAINAVCAACLGTNSRFNREQFIKRIKGE